MFTRRGFIGMLGGMAAGAVLLPSEFVALAADTATAKQSLDGWVTLVVPTEVPGFVISREVIRQMAANFDKPLPLDIDFHSVDGQQIVGWVSEVRLSGDALEARLELPSFQKPKLATYQAIVPAFVTEWRIRDGSSVGAKLVAAALTNSPAVPGTELR